MPRNQETSSRFRISDAQSAVKSSHFALRFWGGGLIAFRWIQSMQEATTLSESRGAQEKGSD